LRSRAIAAFLAIVMALAIAQFWGYSGLPVAHAAAVAHQQTQMPQCGPCYTYYGSVRSWMSTATSDWFEQQPTWCGVASIRAIQRYDWIYYGGSNGTSTTPGWDNSQTAIFNTLKTTGQSPWGRGSGGSGLASNISGDYGTDPHSIAYGAWQETPVGTNSQPYNFHNWIYRTDATTATYDLATDFGAGTVSHNDPVSATINAGAHSFVISGFFASSDPSYGGVALQSIDTWDPWLNSSNQPADGKSRPYNQTQEQIWSLSDWTSLGQFWGRPYNTSGSDPEPNTPNTYYVPNKTGGITAQWNGYYVTIEQDRYNDNTTSHNFAIDQNGNLAPHN
jgi:hypothetical protein